MSDRVLGLVMGVIAAILLTAGLAIATIHQPELARDLAGWKWRAEDPFLVPVVPLLCGVPIGVLVGSLLGSLPGIDRLSANGRVLVVFVGAFVVLAIALPWWPKLGLYAVPLTLFHAALRRSEPPPAIPLATVIKDRRLRE